MHAADPFSPIGLRAGQQEVCQGAGASSDAGGDQEGQVGELDGPGAMTCSGFGSFLPQVDSAICPVLIQVEKRAVSLASYNACL